MTLDGLQVQYEAENFAYSLCARYMPVSSYIITYVCKLNVSPSVEDYGLLYLHSYQNLSESESLLSENIKPDNHNRK